MSGTSLDGVDILAVRFSSDYSFEIKNFECIGYSSEWQEKLSKAKNLSVYFLAKLNIDYGFFLGDLVKRFNLKYNLSPHFVASHGHTIFHNPAENLSFQLGNGNAIASRCGLPVVFDFRVADVCQGGQGAPLVPGAEFLLFPEYSSFLNLGGIANISYKTNNENIVAYDICFCNILLNIFANRLGFSYDEGGKIASSGNLDLSLIQKLKEWDYLHKDSPKSLDKDTIIEEFSWLLDYKSANIEDILCTLNHFIADSITTVANKFQGNILTTGGGAFNSYLIHLLNEPSRLNGRIEIADKLLIEAKEALVFAMLGLLRWEGKINILKEVTGARIDTIGGVIALG